MGKKDYPYLLTMFSLPLPIIQAYFNTSMHVYWFSVFLFVLLLSLENIKFNNKSLIYGCILFTGLIFGFAIGRSQIYVYLIPLYGVLFSLFYRNFNNIDVIYKIHIIYIIFETIVLRFDFGLDLFTAITSSLYGGNTSNIQAFIPIHNRILDGTGSNRLILGPQSSSLICLLSALWFLKPFHGHTNIKWFAISLACSILSPTMTTSLLLMVSILIILFKSNKLTKRVKRRVWAVVVITAPFYTYLMFNFILTSDKWFDYYWNNFFGIFKESSVTDILFNFKSLTTFTEIGFINILNHYSIVELFLVIFIPYAVLTAKIHGMKQNHSIILLISFFSLMHYLPIFSISFIQILAYHMSFLIRDIKVGMPLKYPSYDEKEKI